MKIDSSQTTAKSVVGGERKGAAKAVSSSASAAPAPQVALSSLSSRLQELEGSLASSPAMNSERVAEIRQAIAQGNFKIDSSKIADGLIDSVRQMFAAKNRPA